MRQETLQKLFIGIIVAVVIIGAVVLGFSAKNTPRGSSSAIPAARTTFDPTSGVLTPPQQTPTPSTPQQTFDSNKFRTDLLDEIGDMLSNIQKDTDTQADDESTQPQPTPTGLTP